MNAEAIAIYTLLEGNINHFPITSEDIEVILRRLGWKIFRYDLCNQNDISKLEKLDLLKYTKKYKTFSYKLGDKKIVLSPACLTAAEAAHAMAHELAHIKYGHFSDTGVLGHHLNSTYDDFQEAEAEEFVRAFLAPYCILRKIHSLSEEGISKYTSLERNHAKTRASELRFAYRRLDPIENRLVNNFKNYIEQHSKTNNPVLVAISVLLCVIIMLISTVADNKLRENTKPEVTQTTEPVLQPTQEVVVPQSEPSMSVSVQEEQTAIDNVIVVNGIEFSNDFTVYKTRTGKKFHRENCGHLKNRVGVTPKTLEEAINTDLLEACSDCF